MAIFEMGPQRLRPIDETTFGAAGVRERDDLQRLLRAQVDVVSPDTLVIAEEFCEWDDSRRRIDLLGLDRQANLVVIELKRTEDGGHVELQAVRYAAMVSAMTFEKAVDVYSGHRPAWAALPTPAPRSWSSWSGPSRTRTASRVDVWNVPSMRRSSCDRPLYRSGVASVGRGGRSEEI